jgi:uncharacterized protein (DUF2062 family)
MTSMNNFWRRHFIQPVVHQLTQGITAEKIALTLALGSACALFPIVGTTTLLCLFVGIALRLNQPAIQLVNGICTPVHLPVIVLLYQLSNRLFGVSHAPAGIHFFSNMFWILWDTPRLFLHRFGDLVWHMIVAWALVAPFWIAIVYAIALPVLREIERLRRAAALKDGGPPPNHPVP